MFITVRELKSIINEASNWLPGCIPIVHHAEHILPERALSQAMLHSLHCFFLSASSASRMALEGCSGVVSSRKVLAALAEMYAHCCVGACMRCLSVVAEAGSMWCMCTFEYSGRVRNHHKLPNQCHITYLHWWDGKQEDSDDHVMLLMLCVDLMSTLLVQLSLLAQSRNTIVKDTTSMSGLCWPS